MITKTVKIQGFSTSIAIAKLGTDEEIAHFLDTDAENIYKASRWAMSEFWKSNQVRFSLLGRWCMPSEDMLVELAFSICRMSRKKATKNNILLLIAEIKSAWFDGTGFSKYSMQDAKEQPKTELEILGAAKILGHFDRKIPGYSNWKIFALSNCHSIDMLKDVYVIPAEIPDGQESAAFNICFKGVGHHEQHFCTSPEQSTYIGHSLCGGYIVFAIIEGEPVVSIMETARGAMSNAITISKIQA